jgi:hypothetical protein
MSQASVILSLALREADRILTGIADRTQEEVTRA